MKRVLLFSNIIASSLSIACGDDGGDDSTAAASTTTTTTSGSTSSGTTTSPTTTSTTTTSATTGDPTTASSDPTLDPPTGTTGAAVCEGGDPCRDCAAQECCAEQRACADDPECVAALACVFETCTDELSSCKLQCGDEDHVDDPFQQYAGCLDHCNLWDCPRCTRVPDSDALCASFGDEMTEAWQCPADQSIQGPCGWAASQDWEGWCCPPGFPGASAPPL